VAQEELSDKMTKTAITENVVITLSSRRTGGGHFLQRREQILLICGKSYDEFLSHSQMLECLTEARTEFDNELQTAAERFKDHRFGSYLWLYTPDFLRAEDVLGLYRVYYFRAIIRLISQIRGIKQLIIKTPVTPGDKKFFKSINCPTRYCFTKIAGNALMNTLLNAKQLFRLFRFNLSCLLRKKNPAFTGSLIDTSTIFQKNRYDDIKRVEEILNHNIRYYSGEQRDISGVDKSKTVVFKRELTAGIFLSSLKESVKIRRFIRRNKSNIPSGLYYNHKGFFRMLLYWDLIMAQQCMEKYLQKSSISYIIQVSTLTKPIYRSLTAAAKKHNAMFIQVASRSLMINKCSDRLLPCDVNEYNETALPDRFVFRDKFSLKVFDHFPELQAKTLIGGRFAAVKNTKDNTKKPPALLLMLNHRKDISLKLIEEVRKSGVAKTTETLIFRCHPSFRLSIENIRHFFPGNEIRDNTGRPYSELSDYRIVVISGPTTGSLEAVQFGSVIIWVPYIWDDSIMLGDIMKETGIMTEHYSHILEHGENMIRDHEAYCLQLRKDMAYCQEFFSTGHLISEQIEQIMNDTNDRNQ
jgi:hypothetical protein